MTRGLSRAARYAVYAVPGLVPEDGPRAAELRELGEAALATSTRAKRYGWHATLKAPFRLAEGVDPEHFDEAVGFFAASHCPVTIPSVALRAIGGFWAIVPGASAPALMALADDAVRKLDPWRADLTPQEIVYRRPERLTKRQLDLLRTWGYPFVLDEFRFHCTLTDDLDEPEFEDAGLVLAREFAGVLGTDIPVSALALYAEPEPGATFELVSVHPLIAKET
jgi:hypothetical protein